MLVSELVSLSRVYHGIELNSCGYWTKFVRTGVCEWCLNFSRYPKRNIKKRNTRKGIDASVILWLTDARFMDCSTSILGLVESSLHNGPILFPRFLLKSLWSLYPKSYNIKC